MENLYMFAIMPPADLAARIHNERENFAAQYKCVAGLKPPVHITVYEPFKENERIETELATLQKWAEKQTPFTIELNNYNYFNNPHKPVIFIDVAKNETLNTLRKTFMAELRKIIDVEPSNTKYAPHFTIGYRDVSPAIFPAIKEEYSRKRFTGTFICDAVHLWKHDGKKWHVHQTYHFKGKEDALKTPTLF